MDHLIIFLAYLQIILSASVVSESDPSSCRRLQRLSQSAHELSLIDCDENAGSTSASAALPADKATKHVLGDLCSSPPPSRRAGGHQSTISRKPSPIRAFLTPPLMRKRKPSTKHDDDHGSSSRISTAGLHNSRGKPCGFFSILKVLHIFVRVKKILQSSIRRCVITTAFCDLV